MTRILRQILYDKLPSSKNWFSLSLFKCTSSASFIINPTNEWIGPQAHLVWMYCYPLHSNINLYLHLPIRAWNGIHTTTFQKIHKRLKKWGEIFFVRSKSSTFDKICCVQKSKIIYLRLLVHGTQSEEEDRTKLLIFQMFGDITALKAGISSSSCAEINSTEWNLSPHKSY